MTRICSIIHRKISEFLFHSFKASSIKTKARGKRDRESESRVKSAAQKHISILHQDSNETFYDRNALHHHYILFLQDWHPIMSLWRETNNMGKFKVTPEKEQLDALIQSPPDDRIQRGSSGSFLRRLSSRVSSFDLSDEKKNDETLDPLDLPLVVRSLSLGSPSSPPTTGESTIIIIFWVTDVV